jgi:hypothetical protein
MTRSFHVLKPAGGIGVSALKRDADGVSRRFAAPDRFTPPDLDRTAGVHSGTKSVSARFKGPDEQPLPDVDPAVAYQAQTAVTDIDQFRH